MSIMIFTLFRILLDVISVLHEYRGIQYSIVTAFVCPDSKDSRIDID